MAQNEGGLDALISKIYDCALQPALWPDVLQDISQRAGAFGAMIFDCESGGHSDTVVIRNLSSVYDGEVVRDYVQRFNAFELRDQARFAALSTSGDEVNLIRCDDLAAGRAQLEAQDNVQAMMGMGIHYRAGALLSKNTLALDRFALQFRRAQGPMAEDKRLTVQALLPHVSKALSIGRSVRVAGQAQRSLTAVFDQIPFGIAIVRGNGDVVFANAAFGVIAEKYRISGRLGAGKVDVGRLPEQIQRLLAAPEHHGKFGARPLREGAFVKGARDQSGLFIEASPIRAHPEFETFGAGTYALSLLDSDCAMSVDASLLRRFFPMTDTELAVLDLVVKGHTNAEIAEIRKRSVETVNSQIKAMLLKSSTRNRTELVRMAVSVAASGLK